MPNGDSQEASDTRSVVANKNAYVKCPASEGGMFVHMSKISDCEPTILCRYVDKECVKQKERFGRSGLGKKFIKQKIY